MSGHGDHCNPFGPASGQGNPSVWTCWDHKEEDSSSSSKKKRQFLGYLPDNDASRVVCMGCPTVVLSLCFFILVLVTQSRFLCLHITVYKLLLVNYFRVFIAQPIWIWFMITLVRAFELLLSWRHLLITCFLLSVILIQCCCFFFHKFSPSVIVIKVSSCKSDGENRFWFWNNCI